MTDACNHKKQLDIKTMAGKGEMSMFSLMIVDDETEIREGTTIADNSLVRTDGFLNESEASIGGE
jgi:hypothetical protein